MEIANSHRTPSSKRHRHVNLTGGDRDDNEDDEDAAAAATSVLLKSSGPTSKILRHWHQPGSRIYRVSRASGGKDRHSKVYTAKGLRDRRVRLSVSTAIQFYDLQDRLGYDQPSKAIEWLIKAADPAIAELPSLDAMFPSDEITLARPKRETVITRIADVNNQQSSASETSRSEIRERASQNLNPRSSFTELLTGGASAKYMPPVTSTPDYRSEFGMVPFEMQQFDFLQQDHFFPVAAGNGGGDSYNPNFSISSGLAGFHRGTLQSNSQSIHHHQQQQQHVPFLFGTAASAATSAHEGRYPAGYDGHLQHLELKGKGKG